MTIVPYTNTQLNPYQQGAQQLAAYLYRTYGPSARRYVRVGAQRFWGTRNTRNIRGMSRRKPIDLTGGSKKRWKGSSKKRSGKSRSNVGKYGRWTAPGAKGEDLKFIDQTSNTSLITGVATNASNTHLHRITWSRADSGGGLDGSLVQGIVTGNGPNQRVNQKVVIKSIQIVGTIRGLPLTTNDVAQLGALYLVLDMQCNGEDADPAEIWTPGVSGGSELANLRDLGNSARYRVLRMFPFNVTPNYKDTMEAGAFINFYHYCDIPIEYAPEVDATGLLTNVKSNNLALFMTVEGNHSMKLHVKCRLRFQDR